MMRHAQQIMANKAVESLGPDKCPEFVRADQHARCSSCEEFYRDHPIAVPWTFLTILCTGEYVKL